MTSTTRSVGPWPFVAFGLAVLLAAGIAGAVAIGAISPSVWLDLVAVWPIAGVGLVGGLTVFLLRGRRARHLAIVGLSVFTWLALGLAWHLSGADWLPVAAADITGPAGDGLTSGRLEIDVAGILRLAGGPGATYSVEALRTGGDVGAPTALEQRREGALTVLVVPRSDPGRFVFGGWSVGLGDTLPWTLDVEADTIDADLSGVRTTTARLVGGSGSEVRLAAVDGNPALALGGTQTLVIPPSVQASVTGDVVSAPDGWSESNGILVAPAGSGGWIITVEEGSSVTIVDG